MKYAFILLLVFYVSGCASSKKVTPEETAQRFYQQYLTSLSIFDAEHLEKYQRIDNVSLVKKYVAKGTIERINIIDHVDEQEILGSDYYTYSQDYSIDWVKALKVGKSVAFLGGVIVPVSLGIENARYIDLSVFMRQENGGWKIYRVKNDTEDYEHPIFDAGRLTGAQEYAKTLAPFGVLK
jgi:hypothetical protein